MGAVEPGGAEFGLWLLLAAVFAPAVLMGVGSFLPVRWVTGRVLSALCGMGLSVVCLVWYASIGPLGGVESLAFAPSFEMDLAFRADRLGMFFALLVSGIGCLIVLYARGYFAEGRAADAASLKRFYPCLGLFATAMLGLVLADDFLGMFLFWELTSVSSFLLIGWHREDPGAVKLALQALVVTGLGGMLLLAGLLAVGVSTGAWSFSALEGLSSGGGLVVDGLLLAGLGLVFLGGAAKSAQWPVHFWLPGAMAAPTPVSAYLHSATMVKAGVYLFGRLYPALGDPAHGGVDWWTPTLVTVGATTMLLGAYVALRSDGLKRVFAYTTVSQLGLLVCAYGLGGLEHGVGGAGSGYGDGGVAEANLIYPVTQILNHALYKAPLFIVAGAIIHRLHTKTVGGCRGLIRREPVLAVVALGGLWALAGLPLTLSFAAKEAFLYQIVHAAAGHWWFWAVGAMAVVTAVCNVAILVRFARVFFAGEETAEPPHSRQSVAGGGRFDGHAGGFWASCIWWPAALLVALQFVGGLLPGVFWSVVGRVETHANYWEALPGTLYALTHPSVALGMSGVAIVGGVALGFSVALRRPIEDVHARLFPSMYGVMERFGGAAFGVVQNGNLRTYLALVLLALVLALGAVLAFDTGALMSWPETSPFSWAPLEAQIAGLLLTGLICVSALALPIVRARVVRVLILGVAGFSVTGMYIVYAAPDLALTQIMFEIVSVVLFLLALRLLPEEVRFKAREFVPARVVFSGVVGVMIAWVMLHAGAAADRTAFEAWAAAPQGVGERASLMGDSGGGFALLEMAGGGGSGEEDSHGARAEPVAVPDNLGGWFLRNSYEGTSPEANGRGGGGNNVVNVILVDFRGYDTIGEITVLAITMMGVLALLGSVPSVRRASGPGEVSSVGGQPHLRSVMLTLAMWILLPLIFIFSGYLFFKGHNEPGGGFIAGLVASVGLAAYRMTAGGEALRRLVPLKPGIMAASGLAVALATGFAPLLVSLLTGGVYGGPFLTSDNAYIGLPGGGEFHWTSVLLFDLGVFQVVIAATMGIVNRFEEELE